MHIYRFQALFIVVHVYNYKMVYIASVLNEIGTNPHYDILRVFVLSFINYLLARFVC